MTNTCVQNSGAQAHESRRSATALATFVYKLLPPLPHQRVERGASMVSRWTPFALRNGAIFEPMQGRMQ